MNSSEYEWKQDAKSVTINIPIKSIKTSDVDYVLTETVAKINIQGKRWLRFIDFLHEVDFLSHENSLKYSNGVLSLYIVKKEPKIWTGLTLKGLTKLELFQRRQESFRKHEIAEEEKRKTKTELKGRKSTKIWGLFGTITCTHRTFEWICPFHSQGVRNDVAFRV